MDGTRKPWSQLDLVALDLEGTGAQDREDEAILEVAAVPIHVGHPVPSSAYSTLVNPHRSVPRRSWISPGLTDDVLRGAPSLADVEPQLSALINGRLLVGHNVNVDWRLLHRRCPTIEPAGLIDTLKLLRHQGAPKRGLTDALAQFEITGRVHQAAPASQPHRAMWDAMGTALLLIALADRLNLTADDLQAIAGVAMVAAPANDAQATLF